ncbi:MAG: putative major pilin subunit [candidate division WS6 bacterium OLB20]|uniref:Putative major pilin subunit n=1 Tax=candidate division WS6 bacterium OLB20 TaxID=1617426 RepID=A0A136M0K8_9BACT|nr:MAG: putative major pilin subunit [candidate division WS6 bacterium OLB20]
MNNSTKNLKGFTLIEILVVVALIAILAAITIIAINPQQNFQDARNTQRSSDVTQILNAVTQYTAQQGNAIGDLGTIPGCTTSASCVGTDTACVDLATNLVPTYLVAIPTDPQTGAAADTGYTICQEASGRVTVSAPDAEGTTISVSR